MRLIGSVNSPYVRKVRAVIAELGLQDRVDFDAVDARDPGNDLGDHNPLRKVPTLVDDEGRDLFDSPVICHFLIANFAGGDRLLPENGDQSWRILTTEALADGMLDAGVSVRQELLRDAFERSPSAIESQMARVDRSLARLDTTADWRDGEADLGQIAVACALEWFSFRFPQYDWQTRHDGLAVWCDRFLQRPALWSTRPG